MPTRRHVIVCAGLAPLLAVTAVAADTAPPRVGLQAPPFEARDIDGKLVSLETLKGKLVVLEWTNPECPWVAKHYVSGNMQALQADATARGAVWLTISSAARGQVGFLDDLEAAALTDQRKAKPSHVVLDHSGQMLTAYGVTYALTLAVIAPDGRLAYYGALDDQPNARAEDVHKARNFVRAALDAVGKGEAPSPAQTRPYGCAAR